MVGHAADQRCMIWVSRPRGDGLGSATIIRTRSLFRTLKYCPQWPSDGFASLDAAREWVRDFMTWYNEEHRHSPYPFVTPTKRHRGEDKALLAKRDAVYQAAERDINQVEWQDADWTPIGAVMLNPDRSNQAKQAV